MKKLGFTDPNWGVKQAILAQIEVEDRVVFANQPVAEIVRDYRANNFKLSFAAKEAFTRGIYFIKAIPKL